MSVSFLDEVRAQAVTGLNYARNEYERERCSLLLELVAAEYARGYSLPLPEVLARFRSEVGYATCKVGVNSFIVDSGGRVLLEQRSDESCWGLPGGWVDMNETPEAAVAREVLEETGLVVTVGSLLRHFSRPAGAFGQPHSSVHLLFACTVSSGSLRASRESMALRYWPLAEVPAWHRDHASWAGL